MSRFYDTDVGYAQRAGLRSDQRVLGPWALHGEVPDAVARRTADGTLVAWVCLVNVEGWTINQVRALAGAWPPLTDGGDAPYNGDHRVWRASLVRSDGRTQSWVAPNCDEAQATCDLAAIGDGWALA